MQSISNIWTGRAGLAATYWGYGILGALLWGLALSVMAPGTPMTLAAVLAFCVYLVAVNVGVWRAASIYAGATTWAALGKVAAAVGIVIAVTTLGLVLAAITHDGQTPQMRAVGPDANER